MNSIGKIITLVGVSLGGISLSCAAQSWMDVEFDEEDTTWFGDRDFVEDTAQEETHLSKEDSLYSLLKVDVVIRAGKGIIIGVEEPYHDIMMDGTERYYYSYGLLNSALDTVLSLKYDQIIYLPSFEYVSEDYDVWQDDGPISYQDLRDYGPRYDWILGYDEMAFVPGSITVEKYDETNGHDRFVDRHRATKGYMTDNQIHECIQATQAFMVDNRFMDTETFEFLTPRYNGLIINFTQDFILIGTDQGLGLLDRYNFTELLKPLYSNIVVDPKENLLIVETFDDQFGLPKALSLDSLVSLIKH